MGELQKAKAQGQVVNLPPIENRLVALEGSPDRPI
jgi:hypothetical protein